MGELRFEQDLVRALLLDQHPDLADLELRDVDGGWDNQQWRLVWLCVCRAPSARLLCYAMSRGGCRYWPSPAAVDTRTGAHRHALRPVEHTWTITSSVEGDPADQMPITRIEAAEVLAEFLNALHQQAPTDAPSNPTRGIPLAGFKLDWFDLIADYENADAVRQVWQKAVAAAAWQGDLLWLHCDLHPANVVVRDGRLATAACRRRITVLRCL